jgi:hypothetical protein
VRLCHCRQAWDLALDRCLAQLPRLFDDNSTFEHSTFFAEQLTAFQVWLTYGSEKRNPPEQLPIVLQVAVPMLNHFTLKFVMRTQYHLQFAHQQLEHDINAHLTDWISYNFQNVSASNRLTYWSVDVIWELSVR